MTDHSLRALVYHSPLVVVCIFAVGVQAAETTTEYEGIFKTTLNDCVNSRSDELSGWDRIVKSFYYDAESVRRCWPEVAVTLQMMEDKNYIENQGTDSGYREHLTHIDKFTLQYSGRLNSEELGSGFNVIRYNPDTKRRLESRAETPIKTAPGYLTKPGNGE